MQVDSDSWGQVLMVGLNNNPVLLLLPWLEHPMLC